MYVNVQNHKLFCVNQLAPHCNFSTPKTDHKNFCKKMAAVTMTSSFLGSAVVAAPTTKQPSVAVGRGSVVMAKASKVTSDKIELNNKSEETGNGRRDMMFALAAAAACSVANIALADDEPKRGSAEAKKKYAQICVTMPTARICRN